MCHVLLNSFADSPCKSIFQKALAAQLHTTMSCHISIWQYCPMMCNLSCFTDGEIFSSFKKKTTTLNRISVGNREVCAGIFCFEMMRLKVVTWAHKSYYAVVIRKLGLNSISVMKHFAWKHRGLPLIP